MAKPKVHDDWTVLDHGPLHQVADNLWWLTGSVPRMSLKRNMVVVRRDDGTLLLHNCIALKEPAMQELEALGKIATVIVPNHGHRLDAPAFKRRYPESKFYCPSGFADQIASVVPVDGTYDDFPADDSVRFELLDGVARAEGAMIVNSSDGETLVLNDVMMNMDRKRDPLGFVFTTLLGSAPGPRVSRLARLLYIKDQPALRAQLERFAAMPKLKRLIVSHEKLETGAAASAALRQAATYLANPRNTPLDDLRRLEADAPSAD